MQGVVGEVLPHFLCSWPRGAESGQELREHHPNLSHCRDHGAKLALERGVGFVSSGVGGPAWLCFTLRGPNQFGKTSQKWIV